MATLEKEEAGSMARKGDHAGGGTGGQGRKKVEKLKNQIKQLQSKVKAEMTETASASASASDAAAAAELDGFDKCVENIVFSSLVMEIFARARSEEKEKLSKIEEEKISLKERLKSVEEELAALKWEKTAAALEIQAERERTAAQEEKIKDLQKKLIESIALREAAERKCRAMETSEVKEKTVAAAAAMDGREWSKEQLEAEKFRERLAVVEMEKMEAMNEVEMARKLQEAAIEEAKWAKRKADGMEKRLKALEKENGRLVDVLHELKKSNKDRDAMAADGKVLRRERERLLLSVTDLDRRRVELEDELAKKEKAVNELKREIAGVQALAVRLGATVVAALSFAFAARRR